jgi:hypothetical protein
MLLMVKFCTSDETKISRLYEPCGCHGDSQWPLDGCVQALDGRERCG